MGPYSLHNRPSSQSFQVTKRHVLKCSSLIRNNKLSEHESQALVAAVKSDDKKKAEKLLSGHNMGTNNTTLLSFMGQKVNSIMSYVAKRETSVKAIQPVTAWTDACYVENLEGLVKEAPALGPAAADSIKELCNAMKCKVEQTLKELIPLIQTLQKESMLRNLETNHDADVKEAKAKSTRLFLDELNKLTDLDEER